MAGFPRVGERFGRYLITGVLGRGGMGVVFLAVQEDLDRRVALKVLAPELAEDIAFRNRFVREARSLAALDSPHIIQIHEYGELEGCLYIATQYVAGGDLAARVETLGPLRPREALEVVAAITSALEDAHRAGVVHRDVKPANVLLRQTADGVFAYLCDFGIAQSGEEHGTRTSGLIGTLAYMAPERHEGAEASAAGDVYGAGCVLWCALAGSPPYQGTEVQVAIAHARSPVPTWPGHDPVARAIDGIVQRSMAKRPEDRYRSAAEMRADLLRVARRLPAEATTTRDPGVGPAVRPPAASSGRRWALVALVAALLVTAVTAGALMYVADTPPADPEGVSPRADGSGTSDASSPGGPTRLTCWDGDVVRQADLCRRPHGVAGMRWVFPSFNRYFKSCEEVPDPSAEYKVRAWFCPFTDDPQEGVRYNEWRTAADAFAHHAFDYRPYAPGKVGEDGRLDIRVWRRPGPDDHGLLTTTLNYVRWPFSATVQSSRAVGVAFGCAFLRSRSPTDFSISAGCPETGRPVPRGE